jgi:hypothetical protein
MIPIHDASTYLARSTRCTGARTQRNRVNGAAAKYTSIIQTCAAKAANGSVPSVERTSPPKRYVLSPPRGSLNDAILPRSRKCGTRRHQVN